ncbi:MAG TPA: membrane protein insertase YidC [Methylomirabilota bacterium]|jgi:YidC/Oxa1 family membrane protein insertase|nr:membrane protein insertase YidC [Methylomirabilota bacterium]
MDRRTTIALALCLLVFALFTALQTKYAPKPKPPVAGAPNGAPAQGAAPATGTPAPAATGGAAGTPSAATPPALAPAATPATPEQLVVLETPLFRATFTNIGARLVSYELKRYAAAWGESRYAEHPGKRPTRDHEVPPGDRVRLEGAPSFAFDLGSGPALRSLGATAFAVAESTDAAGKVVAVTFTARDSAGMEVRETWHSRPDAYLLDLDVAVTGAAASVQEWSLTTRSWPLLSEANPEADTRMVRAISLLGKDLHRDGAQGLIGKDEKRRDGAALWAGVQSHYFVGMVAPRGVQGRATVATGSGHALTPEEIVRLPKGAKSPQPIAEATLVMSMPSTGAQRFAVYFGPSDYFTLAKLSGAGRPGSLQLEKAVDLGYSWLMPFSYICLQALRWLESWARNWGVAIFLLATIVRLILHPLNMASMKSMRAMQRLQPEMERIREKYKNKPEAMNAAVMALYKENKVNPAGGCLPMVLQMPLFFALYAVLSSAIDLRQAPFVAWIHDLSAPDHLFSVGSFSVHLLPIIMAGTGFLQQRLTPTPAQQASTMYLMNLFMLFLFYGLPSGLVFYWTVMNLYTSLQQWLAIRGDDGVVVPTGSGSARTKT